MPLRARPPLSSDRCLQVPVPWRATVGTRVGTACSDDRKAVVMADELRGQKVAFVATDGVEQVELTEPWRAVEAAGGEPVLVSIERGEMQGFDHLDHGDRFVAAVD